MVESEYRADSMDRALYGHSFGGLFGAYTLFKSDGAFQRFIIGSPSLWWDDRTIFELESEYSASRNDLSARVFLSVGQLEPEEPYRMVTNFQEFISILERRDYDGFDLEWWIFEDETHNSVIPPTISRGLRSIYKDREDDGT